MVSSLLPIALGGAVGAVARALCQRALTTWHGSEAAWSTLAVNVAGSLLLGAAVAWFADRAGSPAGQFVMVGLLGAFTTFSTFALEAVSLFRDRGAGIAAAYVGLSVGLALLAFLAGMVVVRGVSP